MKKVFILPLILLFFSCTTAQEPIAKKIAHKAVFCDTTINDDYFWMRLSDEQKEAATPDAQTTDVLNYLSQENQYAANYFEPYKELTETIYNEIKSKIKENDLSVPYLDNGYYYFSKFEAGKNYPSYYRRKDAKGAEDELLLDVNLIAEGKSFCSVGNLSVSPDNSLLAYCTDFVGRRNYSIRFKNLKTGEELPNVITNVSSSFEWGDNKTIYYIGKDSKTLREDKVFRHSLRHTGEDELMYFEEDETFAVRIFKTSDEQYVVIESSQTLTSEARYISVYDNRGSFKCFEPRKSGVLYEIDHIGTRFFIITNTDNADNFKIMTCHQKWIGRDNWREFIPEEKGAFIQSFKMFNEWIAINKIKEANSTIEIVNLKTKETHTIDFDSSNYSAYLNINKNVASNSVRISFTSFTSPLSVYDYDMSTRTKTLLKATEVPGYNKGDYVEERVWATARDGAKIPISLIYKKDFVKNGEGKVLLEAYGAYGNSSTSGFYSWIFPLLDRGFAYGIAHIRGGSDLGREWYYDGKLLNKKNTFFDFNDCTRYLIDNGYTTSEGMFATGGSAGGLLMGAIVNYEPELYKGIIADVPFVDVINTMVDETIPLTTFEWDEWGDPRTQPYFDYMLSYSPYDNVRYQYYPNIFVTSGYWDSQVQYWEPAKWVAKLREHKLDNNNLIFMCDMESGHGGASGRYNKVRKIALKFTFILSL